MQNRIQARKDSRVYLLQLLRFKGLLYFSCSAGSTVYPAGSYTPSFMGSSYDFHLLHQKADVFRWHDSGDVQDLKHLAKIFKVARLTPNIKHWLPTREAWIQKYQHRAPSNLVIRFSIPMIDQKASGNWKNTSTVVTSGATCPAPNQGNACLSCRACWDPSVKNVAYGVH
jgi:hypothetical protein